MSLFAPSLRRLRAARGFPSARAFFRAAGGTPRLRCTYKAYLDIEAGRSLPQPPLAVRLALALAARPGAEPARAFAAAYLRALLGRAELAELLIGALGARPEPAGHGAVLRRAARRSFTQRATLALSRAQADRLCASAAHYWCFTLLSTSRASWAARPLARALGLGEGRVAAALRELARLGLLARDADGGWFCPHLGKVYAFPRDELFRPRYRAALSRFWGEMGERRGRLVYARARTLRASDGALRRAFPALAAAVYGANIYALRDQGPDTGIFLIRATAGRHS